jgi:NADH-quinone oxidoreductase subunit L
VQPAAGYFPTVHIVEFTPAIAVGSTLVGLLGIGLAYAYWFQGSFHGATERSKLARTGHTVLVNKYYFDHLYTGIIANGTKGPIASAANWVNSNVIDGVVNGTAVVSRAVAGWLYRNIDQGAIDGTVNGSGMGAEGAGQILRRMQTGRVQQYGTLLFGGAVVLAGILIFAI